MKQSTNTKKTEQKLSEQQQIDQLRGELEVVKNLLKTHLPVGGKTCTDSPHIELAHCEGEGIPKERARRRLK